MMHSDNGRFGPTREHVEQLDAIVTSLQTSALNHTPVARTHAQSNRYNVQTL
jgi:hypothetical protein